ncbi:hypothetical protein PR202_ga28468 [Eleusine coracana subsp. coracana]|uniref:Phytosulfokine n=1 Tax=Eleusine coracana subsp. coracana TaxID=191504 RepID=A0AAV5DJH6_ELECO|nr:hypothetical protein PR202_ga28468 [Eleusine coracana subsp. coracana]
MARATTAMVLALLLLASAPVAMAGRPGPTAEANKSGAVDFPNHHQKAAAEQGCEDDECMARRTLAAHTDYIYTQEHHH